MNVDIQKELKLSKIDHLFVALAEKDKDAELPAVVARTIRKAIDGARFEGRADDSITILADEPRKITLMKRRSRTRVLTLPVTTSGRRFLERGVLATAFLNWRIVALYRMGRDVGELAALYRGR